MILAPPLRFLLAAQVLCASLPAMDPGGGAAMPEAGLPLKALRFEGGAGDDQTFARVAAALPLGRPLTPAAFRTALAAIRATDRFRSVEGELTRESGACQASIRLDPWPVLESIAFEGAPASQFRGLRVGDRIGDERLAFWRQRAQTRLRENGHPEAEVQCQRGPGDRTLKVTVRPGAPARVLRVEVAGSLGPYLPAQLIGIAKVVPGKTLWTQVTRLSALDRLRKRFLKDKRYESQVDLAWLPEGVLSITVNAGPVVRLESEGDGLGWRVSLKDLVPVARANRYSPEILDEGERRMVRALRAKGYLDAQVSHRREVLRTGPSGPEEVRVTYTLRRGLISKVRDVRFERNREISEQELRKAAALPRSLFSFGGPVATPDLVDAVEARVKALYLSRGFPEATVRLQPLQRVDGRTDLVFRVSEGPRHLIRWLKLDLPPGAFGDPWGLGECLALVLSDRPQAQSGGAGVKRFGSDRPGLAGVVGTLKLADTAAGGAQVFTLELDRPIPLLKADLAKVFSALRQQRLPALGVVRPVVRLSLEATDGGTGVHLEVPDQPVEHLERLVVQGAGRTRARAILRETQLNPGAALDLTNLAQAQARLTTLGAFQRVDLTSLEDAAAEPRAEAPAEAKPSGDAPAEKPGRASEGPPAPWKQGDLLLRLEERNPWLVTSSFGYDQSQGYHIGLGVQRLNLGGMGRTLDFGIRAGNGTIRSRALDRMFPTGTYDRSVDSFTVGYTDPWFAPGLLESWLPERTQFGAEGAYIEERRSLYLLRRRRLQTSLQWSLTPQVTFQVGYRFERVDVAAALEGINSDTLRILARYPARATISAPFAQVVRDTRDNSFDPTEGSYSLARVEVASQLFRTSAENSFVKLDLRQQWTWPLGDKASAGVVALGMRVGMARPTASTAENLPLSERFFAGGPFTQRGVEPDGLGPLTQVPHWDSAQNQLIPGQTETTPLGGQGLALVNLEYRFPVLGRSVWGELFVDSGQVYESLSRVEKPAGGSQFPPFRTSVGLGLIFKVSIPIKLEYAVDLKRLLGRPRTADEVNSQLKGLLVSAGFQF